MTENVWNSAGFSISFWMVGTVAVMRQHSIIGFDIWGGGAWDESPWINDDSNTAYLKQETGVAHLP